MSSAKHTIITGFFVFASAVLGAGKALASVSITGATGGSSISADTAATAVSPAWTTLGTITIAEGANADFATGTDVTLILKAPAGFQFNTAVTPSVTFTAGRDITSAVAAMTDVSTITITLTVLGTTALDTLSIGSTTGIQVQPTAGTPLASGNHIYRPTTGGDTAIITGIATSADGSSGSNLGSLTEVAGVVAQLAFTTQPGNATAGVAFGTQPVVQSEDQFGNPATNGLPANSFVAVSLTAGTGPLQGTTSVNLGMSGGRGTATYSGLRIDAAGNDKQLTATSTNGLATGLSGVFTVNPAAASKLVIGTQPSATATAGVVFAQQPVILIEDAYNNLCTSSNSAVTATRSAGVGTLLGTTNLAAVAGVATFANLAHPYATNITIQFTSDGLTATNSSAIAVSPNSYSQLVVLAPGQTNAPGTASGVGGTATAQTAGTAFAVRILASDAYGNLLNTVTDQIGITSSDPTAVLPANAALVNGTNSFNVTLLDAGSQTVTATDVTTGSQTGTSSALTVRAAAFTKLQLLMPGETAVPGTPTGKTGTPNAQTAGGSYTVTVNAVDANWNLVSTNDTIRIYSSDTNATLPANAALSSGTRTFSLTNKTAGSWTVTASNVTHNAISLNTSPSFTVSPGAFAKLQILVPGLSAAPGSASGYIGTTNAQRAGTAFNVTVNAVDPNWNILNTNDTVHLASSDTNAVLAADASLVNGSQTLAVTLRTAGSRTVTVSDVTNIGITANTSPSITVNVGPFAQLQVLMPGETAAPGSTTGKSGSATAQTAGTAFNVTVRSVDASWNLISTNDTVHITASDPTATLPANNTLSSGSRSFSVTLKTAGSQTVTASDVTHSAITPNISSPVTVNAGALARLQLLVPGETAAPGTTSGKTGTPFAQAAGNPFAVQVNAVDANWNVVSTNDTIHISSTDTRAGLPANAALTAGSWSPTVTLITITNNTTITASDLTHASVTSSTSPRLTVGVPVNQALPVVAIHDSEFTRALESMPASGATPTGPGTTGFQWWPAAWHYFVMPESVKEALRSDGTAFAVVSDADISAGRLLDTNGRPRYAILISLAAEAIGDDEIAQFTNYVAAGGTLLAGSSAFTRTTNGVSRGDFAFANAMGVHMVNASLGNWVANRTFTKSLNHPLVSHIPGGALVWNMPTSADEISWGVSPGHNLAQGHLCWLVQAGDATVIAQGDTNPYLLVKPFGKGNFIYDAAMQPLIGHGGNAPGMYAYCIFRNAIQAAFAAAKAPIPKVSPWPYPYDAAFIARHDLENLQDQISSIEASAQFEYTNGARGDYYFCTGTLRVEMTNNPAAIAGLRRAVTNYGAVVGPHNGGLRNINDYSLVLSNYTYWHWATDESLDVTGTNLPSGYANGTAYASASTSNSFQDVEGWLAGVTNGLRLTVAPNFNATREASYQIEEQLNVRGSGEEKLSVFPSWVLSTSLQTANKRYPFISPPPSDWFRTEPSVIEAMETGHTPQSITNLVDYYYNLGALINLYNHSSSAGGGLAGANASYYVLYGMSKPRMWGPNAASMYSWWLARSNMQISATYTTNGNRSVVTLSISGTTDPQAAVEVLAPGPSVSAVQVLTNGVAATANGYRNKGPVIKVLVGRTVSNVQISYILNPASSNDFYTASQDTVLAVPAPGVLANDTTGSGTNLAAVLVSGPAHGVLSLTNNGGFTYTPQSNYTGIDSFTYLANDGVTNSAAATVTISVTPPGGLFFDDFSRNTNADPLAPWVPAVGTWTITGGQLQGADPDMGTYNTAYVAGNWTNFSVQAQLQFPAGAFGGGLEGRVNPVSGASYAVNVYPNGFPGESTSPEMKLVKFHSWNILGNNPMRTVSLPTVGTSPHTLQLTFRGSRIMAYFDGALVLDVTDNGFDGLPVYTSGGIGAHFYEYFTPYVMTYDNVLVSQLPVTPVAVADSYSMAVNHTLTVAAPGVLGNDVPGAGTNLTAVLVTGPTNGTVNLSTNGGFSYQPAPDYMGTDSFTYQAVDSVSNSTPALVTITITTNAIPVANNDSYDYVENTTLTVAAPGILANDTDANGDSLTAVLVSAPVYGTLNLSPNGGFTYTPATNFSGTDSFTYMANDGFANSGVATVTLADRAAGAYFYDNFARSTDPGPLAPWVAQSGVWTVTGGVLRGGTDPLSSYGSAYLTNNWTDYAVEGRFQFSAGAYGGALCGRLNPVTGARYAVWIYPQDNDLNLIKFESWQFASYPADFLVRLLPLPALGTNWHALKLAFQGNQVAVYYDGNLVASVTDAVNPYPNGGVGVDMYTDTTPYTMSVGDVIITPLVTGADYSVSANTTLTVPAPGLLGNDTGVYGTNLVAVLLNSPTNGTLYLTNNGGFSYTPSNNYVGPDSFTYQAKDGQTNLGTGMINITVIPGTNALAVAITGTVAYYPTNYPPSALSTNRVGNVTMSLTGDTNLSVFTLADGSYGLSGIVVGGTYCVTPSKTDDSPTRNGVSSFDQALIQAHLLKQHLLDSPYKLLAADVSGDGKINSFDQAYLQAFILGQINQFPAGLWRFVPADYVFPDPQNPWAPPTNRWYTNLLADVTNGDFVAIKLGEVANLWTAPVGGHSLLANTANAPQGLAQAVPGAVFAVSQQSAQPGQTVSVGVTVSGFHQVTSAQFSLAWDPAVLRYVGTGSYGLKGLSSGSFGTTLAGSGKLAFAWYDSEAVGVTLADGTALFNASFEVIGKAGSVSVVALAGSPTAQQVSVDFAVVAFGAQDGSVAVVGPGVLVGKSVYTNGVFRLSVPTEQGRSYILEFTDSLALTNWTPLPAVAGDGTVNILVDPAATNQQRFYRVHVQ